jgi:hypothetical protein
MFSDLLTAPRHACHALAHDQNSVSAMEYSIVMADMNPTSALCQSPRYIKNTTLRLRPPLCSARNSVFRAILAQYTGPPPVASYRCPANVTVSRARRYQI